MELEGSSLALELGSDLILQINLWQFSLGVILLAAGCCAFVLAPKFGRQQMPAREPEVRVPSIDVAQLDASGPHTTGPTLEIYGTAVRVALVVLAPVGRDSDPPREEDLTQILEQLIPRLSNVTASDAPDIHIWPEQLSSHGFTNAFFNNVPLPGDRGKGSPWCSVAGKFTAAARHYLIGLVCCGVGENGLTQFVIEHEGRWNDVVRVKS